MTIPKEDTARASARRAPAKAGRFREPWIRWHLAALAVTCLLSVPLSMTFMVLDLAAYRTVAMTAFAAVAGLANLLAGLALRRIGWSPWLALSGFVMGLIPLILYATLPDRSEPTPDV